MKPSLNQNYSTDIKYETSNIIQHTEENIWELMESLQYSQSKFELNPKYMSFKIVLLIFTLFILGIIIGIIIYRWNTKKTNIFIKI